MTVASKIEATVQYAAVPDAKSLEQYPDDVLRVYKIKGLIEPV